MNAPEGTACTGGACSSGVCVAAALAAPAVGAAGAAAAVQLNNPPLPTDDLYSFIGGQNSDVVYTDEVLLNDIDPDNDPLNVVAVNQDSNSVGMAAILPSGASLTVEADGSFLYDPRNLFNNLHTGDTATETFEYTVSDGQRNTEVATVTIVIEGNNDPPMAANDTETTTEDMTVSSSVLLNDSDPEGDNIRLVVDTMNGSSGNVGQEIVLPSGAKVFLTSDGLYTFDPNGQYESLNDSETAIVTFEYTITDGFGGTAGATATIVISGANDPPVAENDDLGPAPAGLPVTYNLLTNDVNPEQNELVVTEVEGQSIGSSGSTTISLSSGALMTIDGSTGEMTVDPNGQFESLDDGESVLLTFEYVVADGNGVTDSAIVTLTLQGSNDPPFAEDVSKATRPGSVVSATLLDNDGDPENDPLTVTQVEDALLNPMTGDIVVTLPSGALVTVNALGQYTYDPNGRFDSLDANQGGIDIFTYAIADGNGGSDKATVTILMPGVNDPPDAEDDSKTTLPTSTVSDSAILPNDSDPESDDLILIEVNGERIDPLVSSSVAIGLPSGAVVTINTDGDYTYNPNGQFDSLDINEEGIDTFTYTISDGNGGTDEATLTILMPGVNDPPMPEDDIHSLQVGEALAFSDDAFANDSDPDGDDATNRHANVYATRNIA